MSVIEPPPVMARAAALATRKLLTRLTSRTPRSSAAVRSSTRPTDTMPAAWTTSVSGPRDCAASMPAAAETARPMAPAAPVTSATRPASRGPSAGAPLDKLHHHVIRGENVDAPEAPPVSPRYLHRRRMGRARASRMQLGQQSVQVLHLQAQVCLPRVVHPALQRLARGAEVPEKLD